ncbi:MAG: ABC transporter family substrate-binding protein [Actinomycetota bacterium]|nr:ABC transporter family substrate-binding protein [Actinomycetota bacterium]
MRTRRPLALLAAASAAVMALTACGGGGGGGDGGGGTDAGEVGVNDINPMAAGQLGVGGDFRWPLSSMPPNFNRLHLDGSEADNRDVMSGLMPGVYDGLPDGTVEIDPAYAESAELTSEDPQVVTYTINPDATWSDGTAITWEDFQAQWQALNGSNEAFLVSSKTGYEDIGSVERGEDDKQVVVTFATKFSDWQALFSPLYPKSTNTNPEVFNTGWVEGMPVTAGPFKLANIDRTANTITVVRDENWWGEAPKLDRIIYRAIPVDAQIDALANNEVDFIDVGPDLNAFTRAQTLQSVTVRTALAPDYRHITFNGAPGSILADQQLRIAIMKGIDRQIIGEALIGQLRPDVRPLGNHIYVEGLEGFQDNDEIVSYDPEEAGRLLDELGWTRQGDGIRMKDGQPLRIRDIIPTNVATSDQESRVVQQQLRAIGVEVNIETVPLDNFFEQFIRPGDFDITHFSWLGTPFPASSSSSIYGLGPDSEQNYGRIGSDRINELFAQASAELDPQRKIELANEADREIWAVGHSLLLYQRPNVVAVRNNVANFGAFGFASAKYREIGFTN